MTFQAKCKNCDWQGPVRDSMYSADKDVVAHWRDKLHPDIVLEGQDAT